MRIGNNRIAIKIIVKLRCELQYELNTLSRYQSMKLSYFIVNDMFPTPRNTYKASIGLLFGCTCYARNVHSRDYASS